MGLTFPTMTTVAMRNVEPLMAGAASGVFNSLRQMGSVIGSSVVGAVLQSQLAMSLAARDSYAEAYVQALRTSLAAPVALVAVGALSTLFLARRRRTAAVAETALEALAVAG
jgi:hypothetical protein